MDILLTVLLTAAGSYPQFYSLLSLNNLFLSKQSKSHPRQIPNATDDLKRRAKTKWVWTVFSVHGCIIADTERLQKLVRKKAIPQRLIWECLKLKGWRRLGFSAEKNIIVLCMYRPCCLVSYRSFRLMYRQYRRMHTRFPPEGHNMDQQKQICCPFL